MALTFPYKSRRTLVWANEAGQGALISALLPAISVDPEPVVLASRAAFSYFEQRGFAPRQVDSLFSGLDEELDLCNPDCLIMGASVVYPLEKKLLEKAQFRGIPVHCFVDHYWNLWQRFADEQTRERWKYLPEKIWVMESSILERMCELGCPRERLGVFSHPVLREFARATPGLSVDDLKRKLGLSPSQRYFVFVSDYRFSDCPEWDWDQPDECEYRTFFRTLVDECARVNQEGKFDEVCLVVKLHPAEETCRWREILDEYPDNLIRVIREIDKVSLLDNAAAVFGLDSMFLLEALERGKNVYSFHQQTEHRNRWLSTLNNRIRELGSEENLRFLVRDLSTLPR